MMDGMMVRGMVTMMVMVRIVHTNPYQPISTCTNQAMVGPGKDQDLNQEFDNIVLSSLKSLLLNR